MNNRTIWRHAPSICGSGPNATGFAREASSPKGVTPVASTAASCQMIRDVSGSRVPSRVARRGVRGVTSATVAVVSSSRLRAERRNPRAL